MKEIVLGTLRDSVLGERLSEEDLDFLAGLGRRAEYAADTFIFEAGQPRARVGVIRGGRVEIRQSSANRPKVLRVLGSGEVLGEGALLDGDPHSTSAYVVEAAEIIELSREEIDRIAAERPELHARLAIAAARIIAARLRAASAPLAGGLPDHLTGETRRESDLLGEREVPDHCYFGVQTLRAAENFPITGVQISQYPHQISALAAVKEAAAMANRDLGLLDPEIADAIIAACREIRSGHLHEHFVVDVIQGGAGTSTNMNANEVIANRALEILGRRKGEYDVVHPNNHVNLSQSTNDVYPTSLKIAANWAMQDLEAALAELSQAFLEKGEEFGDIVKMGRTQLQDAVPMTLGQEFRAFGHSLGEDVERLREAVALTREINMGGTAIGTGINTDPRYAELVRHNLSEITGLELGTSSDLIAATPDLGSFVSLSGALRRLAVKLSKICNDLRLLSSGPRAGLGEINLPAMQPGSSIMPGKVNPVIPEVVNQVCHQVIGNDLTVTVAAEGGQLQLNVFEPVLAFNIFQSIETLTQACTVLRERCVTGITPNHERIRHLFERSIGIVTALVPFIGYERSTAVAKEALETDRGVYELVLEKGWLSQAELDELLTPEAMTQPRAMPTASKPAQVPAGG